MSAAQSQKHLTHNDAIKKLDTVVQLSVKSSILTAPPGSPVEGDRYIIGSSPTGAWAGKDLNVTSYLDGVWVFFPPRLGWIAFDENANALQIWNGTAWVDFAGSMNLVSTTSMATFTDTLFTLQDNADNTKKAVFELSGLSTGTTRTYTLPNLSGTLATTGTLTQTFSGTTTFSGTFTASGATASLGTSTAASTVNVGTGATTNGTSKSVNIGTGGVSGSTTTLVFGSATSGALGTATFNSPTITFSALNTAINISGTTTLAGPSTTATLLYLGLGGATPDASNRLSINSPQLLFNHAGASMQATLNKNAAGNDAGFIFQTNWSTRALFGTLGNDDFTIKVSPNGSTFYDGVVFDRNSGKAMFSNMVLLVGQAADPGSPANGDLWYNYTSNRLKARIDGVTSILGAAEVPYIVPDTGRYLKATTTPNTSTTTVAGVANRMSAYPFIPKFDFTCDRIGINVTTLLAGSNAKVAIYDSDVNGRPNQRLTETGDLDCSTAGAKEATASLDFKEGKQYWIVVRTSSTQTLSAFQPYCSPDLDASAIATTQFKTLNKTLTYATAAPATWTYVASEATTVNAAVVWFRMA